MVHVLTRIFAQDKCRVQPKLSSKPPSSPLSGLHRERASAYISPSVSAEGHVPLDTFLQKSRDAVYRAKRSRWGFGRLTLYGIWREVGSLSWRIQALRRSTWYRKRIALSPEREPNPIPHHDERIAELFRRTDTQWLLSRYPRASALDIQLFVLGWDRGLRRSNKILEAAQKGAPCAPDIVGR